MSARHTTSHGLAEVANVTGNFLGGGEPDGLVERSRTPWPVGQNTRDGNARLPAPQPWWLIRLDAVCDGVGPDETAIHNRPNLGGSHAEEIGQMCDRDHDAAPEAMLSMSPDRTSS